MPRSAQFQFGVREGGIGVGYFGALASSSAVILMSKSASNPQKLEFEEATLICKSGSNPKKLEFETIPSFHHTTFVLLPNRRVGGAQF